jgi:hypothetical protein
MTRPDIRPVRDPRCPAVSKLNQVQCECTEGHEVIRKNGSTYDHAAPTQRTYWSTQQHQQQEPSPWSNVTNWVADPDAPNGGRHVRMAWKELYEQEKERRIRAEQFERILMDLDRNPHGRHEGDYDVNEYEGVSRGNPHIRLNQILGYDIGGRVYRMPARANRHKPEAWGPFHPEED